MENKTYKKVVLVILDGFGVASYSHGNAIAQAQPEVLDYIVGHYPSLTLQASGPLVGLPWGEMGNSEVGHLNIGAGRIVGQDLPRINTAIQNGEFFKNPAFLAACDHVKKNNSQLHLAGMISGGNVHSSDEHLYALLGLAAEQGIKKVFIHMFTDGRDTGEKVALESLQKLNAKIAELGVGQVATIAGRFYAMDRGKHWEQTEMTYQAMVNGIGAASYSAEDAILDSYNHAIYDEMIHPTVVVNDNRSEGAISPVAKISEHDAVIFFNFRQDRATQLVQAFVSPEVMGLSSHHEAPADLFIVTMTEYYFGLPVTIAFPIQDLNNNLAEAISKAGLKQFHLAESEKFAHVTSFFNGGVSKELPGEERHIVKSPTDNSSNYSDRPEMSGLEITDILVDKILHSDMNFILANFANADMVGHTGNLEAAIKAVKYLDRFLEKIMEATLAAGAVLIITADHGNIEQMINMKTGEIDKDHTTNPVPFLLIGAEFCFEKGKSRDYLSLSSRVPDGVISDIAPTVLKLMGLPKPKEMTGINLLEGLESNC
jgi:2,3-bisphosphoglycerate-independent phosphoglycerate mutase